MALKEDVEIGAGARVTDKPYGVDWCPEVTNLYQVEGGFERFGGTIIPVEGYYNLRTGREGLQPTTYTQPDGTPLTTDAWSARIGRIVQWAHQHNHRLTAISGGTGKGPYRYRQNHVPGQLQGLKFELIDTEADLRKVAQLDEQAKVKVNAAGKKETRLIPNTITVPGNTTRHAIQELIEERYGPGYYVRSGVTTQQSSSVAANLVCGALGKNRQAVNATSITVIDGDGRIRHVTNPEEIDAYRGTQGLAGVITTMTIKIEQCPPKTETILVPLMGDVQGAYGEMFPDLAAKLAVQMHQRNPNNGVWIDGADMIDKSGLEKIISVMESTGKGDFPMCREAREQLDMFMMIEEETGQPVHGLAVLSARHHSNTPLDQLLTQAIEAINKASKPVTLEEMEAFIRSALRGDSEAIKLVARLLKETYQRAFPEDEVVRTKFWGEEGDEEDQGLETHPLRWALRAAHIKPEREAIDHLREAVPEEGRTEAAMEGFTSTSMDLDIKLRLRGIDSADRKTIQKLQTAIRTAMATVLQPYIDTFQEIKHHTDLTGFINGHLMGIEQEEQADSYMNEYFNGAVNLHLRLTGPESIKAIIASLIEDLRKKLFALHGQRFFIEEEPETERPHVELEVVEGEKKPLNAEDSLEHVATTQPRIWSARMTVMEKRGGDTFYWFRQTPHDQRVRARHTVIEPEFDKPSHPRPLNKPLDKIQHLPRFRHIVNA